MLYRARINILPPQTCTQLTDWDVRQIIPALIRLDEALVDFLEWFHRVLRFPVYVYSLDFSLPLRQGHRSCGEGRFPLPWTPRPSSRWAPRCFLLPACKHRCKRAGDQRPSLKGRRVGRDKGMLTDGHASSGVWLAPFASLCSAAATRLASRASQAQGRPPFPWNLWLDTPGHQGGA